VLAQQPSVSLGRLERHPPVLRVTPLNLDAPDDFGRMAIRTDQGTGRTGRGAARISDRSMPRATPERTSRTTGGYWMNTVRSREAALTRT
jgi:hypothetical protein